MQAERCIEPGDPETTETAFLGATVTMSVLACFDNSFFGLGKQILASPTETFSGFQNILVALFGHDATLDSGHIVALNDELR